MPEHLKMQINTYSGS